MGQLTAWNNLIFLIPLAVGVLLALSAVVGLGGGADHDVGHDLDHDIDHDVSHDAGGDSGQDAGHDSDAKTGNPLDSPVKATHRSPLWVKALSVLGFGKVPLTLVLMFVMLIFGGTGVIMNSVLASTVGAPAFAWLSVAVACLMVVFLTGRLARLVARFVPATETYTTKSEDLIGVSGEVVLTTTREFGTAQVWNKSGDMFQITCRSTEEDSLPTGTKVLVVGHDAATDTYHVVALPE